MYLATNTIWVLLGAILIFIMQAGFAMLETGFTRVKNAGNIAMKNLLDFSLGSVAFFLLGFGFMFGSGTPLFGLFDLGSNGSYSAILPQGVNQWAFIIFQTMFCATAATIVSGAMAERTRFIAYCMFSFIISLLIYPISGHWIWGGGWLDALGFHDFAGSTVVHLVGGTAALAGVIAVGPRTGKYSKEGKSSAIPGQSLTLGVLGVFVLWFGWFGFNAGSTFSIDSDVSMLLASRIMVNTNLSAAVSAATAWIFTTIQFKRADISMTFNAAVAGLVAITAGCDTVSPFGAMIIGLGSGFLVVLGIEFIEKVLKADDPVGAIGVHGICGAYGTIMVGLLSTDAGLLYTGGMGLLVVQILGVLSVGSFVFAAASIMFFLLKKTIGLRVSEQAELGGLDKFEHGIDPAAYPLRAMELISGTQVSRGNIDISAEKIPAFTPSKEKMTKITIVINQDKLEILKEAMNSIGITGMTVANVFGCGIQKGGDELYRSSSLPIKLLPKVQVDIVVTKVPVEDVVSVAEQVLQTGNIGDGKIFISRVDNVFKIRTGERDYEALQDREFSE